MKPSPTARARQAIASAILPQGWADQTVRSHGEERTALLDRPGVVGALGFGLHTPAGTVRVYVSVTRGREPGALSATWTGPHEHLQQGLERAITAALVRA